MALECRGTVTICCSLVNRNDKQVCMNELSVILPRLKVDIFFV